jgi:hypothetical protein
MLATFLLITVFIVIFVSAFRASIYKERSIQLQGVKSFFIYFFTSKTGLLTTGFSEPGLAAPFAIGASCARSATATTTPTNLPVNLTYNGSATAPTNAGSYTVIGTISDANY